MAREFGRSQRLGGQIMRLLNEILRQDSKDPRLEFVSVSAVDLSRDLSIARVFFSTLQPDADPEPVLDGLNSASGFLRSRIGHALKIRHTPELRFQHDDSVAKAAALSAMIDAARSAENNEDSE